MGQISSRAGGTARTGCAVTIPTSNRVTSSSTNADAVAKDTGHSATYIPVDLLISQDASRQNDIQQPSRSASMGLSSRLDRAILSSKTSKLNNGRQACQSGAPSDLPGTSDESSTSIAGNAPAAITSVGFDATCLQSGAAAKTEYVMAAAINLQKTSDTDQGTDPGRNQDASFKLTASSADSNGSSSADADMPANNSRVCISKAAACRSSAVNITKYLIFLTATCFFCNSN